MLEIDNTAAKVYEDVRNDNTKTNWFTLEYVDDSKDILEVANKGNGGLKELVATFSPEKAAYGYLRILIGNDELSQRAKFVFISWCGPQVKVMRRGKMNGHIADVKKIIQSFAIEVSASSVDELDETELMNLLKKAMGANYDRQSSSY